MTIVDEKELFILYQKFLTLGPNAKGYISKNQLMEISEFKYCAFKKFLPDAFKLSDIYNSKKRDTNSNINNPNNLKKAYKKKNTIKINAFVDSSEDEENEKKTSSNKQVNNYIDKNDKDTHFDKLVLNENRNSYEFSKRSEDSDDFKKDDYVQYISFKNFVDIMKLFNGRFPVDIKIRCNIIFIFSLF